MGNCLAPEDASLQMRANGRIGCHPLTTNYRQSGALLPIHKVVEISPFRRPNDSARMILRKHSEYSAERVRALVISGYLTPPEPLLSEFPFRCVLPWLTDQLRWQVRAAGACCRGQAWNHRDGTGGPTRDRIGAQIEVNLAKLLCDGLLEVPAERRGSCRRLNLSSSCESLLRWRCRLFLRNRESRTGRMGWTCWRF